MRRRLSMVQARELAEISARLEAATPSRVPLLTPVPECEHNEYVTTTEIPTATSTFQVGATYSARSLCDYDCIWTFEVVSRTAKFITIRNLTDGETVRVGVRTFDGDEAASPLGTYSMSPTIRASRPGGM